VAQTASQITAAGNASDDIVSASYTKVQGARRCGLGIPFGNAGSVRARADERAGGGRTGAITVVGAGSLESSVHHTGDHIM
jgi:hypothetical protein